MSLLVVSPPKAWADVRDPTRAVGLGVVVISSEVDAASRPAVDAFAFPFVEARVHGMLRLRQWAQGWPGAVGGHFLRRVLVIRQ